MFRNRDKSEEELRLENFNAIKENLKDDSYIKNFGEELGWELGVDFPTWANTEIYVKTISNGYLYYDEKPK